MSGGMCVVQEPMTDERDRPDVVGPHDDWSQLVEALGARFTDGPVYAAAVSAFRGVTPEMVTVRDRGDLRAVSALTTRRVGPVTVATLVSDALGQGGDVLAADGAAARRFVAQLAESRRALRIDELPSDSLVLAALMSSPRWRVRVSPASAVPMLTMDADTTARDVRSSRTIGQLRSARSKYARAGDEVAFELLTTRADLDRRWDDMRRVAEKRGTTRPERDEWLSGDRGRLVRRVLDGEADAGRMRVLGVTAGDRWAGHDIGVRCGRTWARYLTHFDPDDARLQPGHQMLAWMVDHHGDLGTDRIHHGRGSSAVKSAWSDDTSIDAVNLLAVPDTVTASRSVFTALTLRTRVGAVLARRSR